MSDRVLTAGDIPLRTKVWEGEHAYDDIDPGIRFAVRVLHAHGIETCQSCEAGPGHAYPEPSVDMLSGPNDSAGFGALSVLHQFGLPVTSVARVWNIDSGTPYECIWRITFAHAFPGRADDPIMFLWGYQAQEVD